MKVQNATIFLRLPLILLLYHTVPQPEILVLIESQAAQKLITSLPSFVMVKCLPFQPRQEVFDPRYLWPLPIYIYFDRCLWPLPKSFFSILSKSDPMNFINSLNWGQVIFYVQAVFYVVAFQLSGASCMPLVHIGSAPFLLATFYLISLPIKRKKKKYKIKNRI